MSTRRNTQNTETTMQSEPSQVPVPSGYKDNVRYRKRGAGTGYGQSSGYARNRRYAEDEAKNLFRFG